MLECNKGFREEDESSLFTRISRKIFGNPKDVHDPSVFHKLALIPALAWVGLGADGLSSSSYGPEEAFRAISSHPYLALLLGLATAITVFIISYSYSKIIEHFPSGGGGYVVATHTLGPMAGVISGSALIVDYMLTITVSIVSCGDALFSFIPLQWHPYKIFFDATLIILLIVFNIRGIKESILILAPIFILFILTHILLLGAGIGLHTGNISNLHAQFSANFHNDLKTIGILGILAIFLRAYSLGGGTYTGIEAVSNGLQIMKEPRVKTGKRTMLYMSFSLAITAGGLFICYLFNSIDPSMANGQTLNAVLAGKVFSSFPMSGLLVLITILSEGALLYVAAQAGFIDGPRVMANMAVDMWLPRRFANLSERLTMRNGILIMGGVALALLFITRGNISTLIAMYSINVFLTFTLSQLGMFKFTRSPVFFIGLILCASILVITCYEKFPDGGLVTIILTSGLVAQCYMVRRHYEKVRRALQHFHEHHPMQAPKALSVQVRNTAPINPEEMTAIQLVSGYNNFGIHTFYSILNSFPGLYKNIVFVAVAMVDSGSFKGAQEVSKLEEKTRADLEKYVDLARSFGIAATFRFHTGTDVTMGAIELCLATSKEFPTSTVFAGRLALAHERFYHRLLHNDMSYTIQHALQRYEVTTVIMPTYLEL